VSTRVIRGELIGFSFFFAEIDVIHPIVFLFLKEKPMDNEKS
jgi:hypothetical protein